MSVPCIHLQVTHPHRTNPTNNTNKVGSTHSHFLTKLTIDRNDPFNLRFEFVDDDSISGSFALRINDSDTLTKIIDTGSGFSNYKFTYGVTDLKSVDNFTGTSEPYEVQLGDELVFTVRAEDAQENATERSITVVPE